MGMITIKMAGSFPGSPHEVTFSATEGDHANAITRAIDFLVNQLPFSIEKDHKFHRVG